MKTLQNGARTWRGTSRLHDPNTGAPDDSASTLTITPMLRDSFVRLDYTWAYQGAPQEGSLLLGYEAEPGVATAVWIDTWHMGDVAMVCKGSLGPDNEVNVRGSYAAPPGPDWGWRIVIIPTTGEKPDAPLQILMYNILPEGQEEIAVEATYTNT